MSWRAQNRSKDAKTPSAAPAMSRNPKLALCGIQPYPQISVIETQAETERMITAEGRKPSQWPKSHKPGRAAAVMQPKKAAWGKEPAGGWTAAQTAAWEREKQTERQPAATMEERAAMRSSSRTPRRCPRRQRRPSNTWEWDRTDTAWKNWRHRWWHTAWRAERPQRRFCSGSSA